ncbi:hypothetical protein Q2B95_14780 [Stenotrophomonas maltophilia]|uniref:DUF6680 family protein n=1 Tax=Stenotrophomonas maltophilia TaxID=40324 RepID=UPI00309F7004
MAVEVVTITISDILIVGATLVGPIAAVQVQKYLEWRGSSKARKQSVFEALMATRNSPMSMDHVRALNMIEVSFYGKGPGRRKSTEDAVLSAWSYYLAFLNDLGNRLNSAPPEQRQITQADTDRRLDLFVDLLAAVAADLNYNFERATFIPTRAYTPQAHGDAEMRAEAISVAALDILTGRAAITTKIQLPAEDSPASGTSG